jgi:hypothetical protein
MEGLTISRLPCGDLRLHLNSDGTEHVRGNLWWFERYQIELFAQTLLDKGEVVFPLGAPAESVTRQ